ncbi:MAG: MGMT family protein [Xanthomonadaceae bacterium]|nr:MGMT family protein [Xanthomonadaceae bacterium]
MSPVAPPATPEQRILAAIRALPRGQVASYGVIALRAGLPGRARLVARILGHTGEAGLPWHRVLRADGRIAFPAGSAGWEEQIRRLQAEGVQVHNGRVRLPPVEASLDAALWAPR